MSESPNGTDPRRAKFDRALGALDGIPGVDKTSATTIRATLPMIGDVQTFIVQTYRQRDADAEAAKAHFTVFLEYIDESGATRIVVPPKVADAIARQRDALTTRARKKSARAAADERKARGIRPAFLKKRRTPTPTT